MAGSSCWRNGKEYSPRIFTQIEISRLQNWDRIVIAGFSWPRNGPKFLTMRYTPWIYPLVMTNIAMENGPFIDGLPIENGDFPWLR